MKEPFEAFVRSHPRDPLPATLTWEATDRDLPSRAHWLVLDRVRPAAAGDARMARDLNEFSGAGPNAGKELFPRGRTAGRVDLTRRGNTIDIFDPPAVIEKKLKGAFTDPNKLRKGDPGRPEICNVFTMHTALSGAPAVADIDRDCRSGALGCGDCKLRLKDAMLQALEPVQARGAELRREPKRVLDVLQQGRDRARSIASVTMREVKSAMGLGAGTP